MLPWLLCCLTAKLLALRRSVEEGLATENSRAKELMDEAKKEVGEELGQELSGVVSMDEANWRRGRCSVS